MGRKHEHFQKNKYVFLFAGGHRNSRPFTYGTVGDIKPDGGLGFLRDFSFGDSDLREYLKMPPLRGSFGKSSHAALVVPHPLE